MPEDRWFNVYFIWNRHIQYMLTKNRKVELIPLNTCKFCFVSWPLHSNWPPEPGRSGSDRRYGLTGKDGKNISPFFNQFGHLKLNLTASYIVHSVRYFVIEYSSVGNRDFWFAIAHAPYRHQGIHETRSGRTRIAGTQQGRPLQHALPGDSFAP